MIGKGKGFLNKTPFACTQANNSQMRHGRTKNTVCTAKETIKNAEEAFKELKKQKNKKTNDIILKMPSRS